MTSIWVFNHFQINTSSNFQIISVLLLPNKSLDEAVGYSQNFAKQ
jgi:hypothetical protein